MKKISVWSIIVVLTIPYATKKAEAGGCSSSHHEVYTERKQKQEKKERREQDKLKTEPKQLFLHDEKQCNYDSTSSVVERVAIRVKHLYNLLGTEIRIVDENSIEEKKIKQYGIDNVILHDKHNHTVYIRKSDQLSSREQEVIFDEFGKLWANQLLCICAEDVTTHLLQFLENIRIELNENIESIDDILANTISSVEFLNISFLANQKYSLTQQYLLKYEEQIVSFFGNIFKYYYMNDVTRKMLREFSPIIADYMDRLTYEIEEGTFSKLNDTIKKKHDELKIKQNNEQYEHSLRNCQDSFKQKLQSYRTLSTNGFETIGNKVLKEFAGNYKNMNDLNYFMTIESESIEEIPDYETVQLQEAVKQVQEINDWIKQENHRTTEKKIVYTYFDPIDFLSLHRSTDSNLIAKSFTYGLFPDLRIGELVERDQTKKVKMQVEVPAGTYLAPLGDGNVIFPLDEYGIQLQEGTTIQAIPSQHGTIINMKTKLILKDQVHDQMVTAKKDFIQQIAVQFKKKIPEKIILQLDHYFDFQFTGLNIGTLIQKVQSTFIHWASHPKFTPKFYCDFFNTFEQNSDQEKKGIILQNSFPSLGTVITYNQVIDRNKTKIHLLLSQDMIFSNERLFHAKMDRILNLATSYVLYTSLIVPKDNSFKNRLAKCYEKEWLKRNGSQRLNMDPDGYFSNIFRYIYSIREETCLEERLNDTNDLNINDFPKTAKMIFEKMKSLGYVY